MIMTHVIELWLSLIDCNAMYCVVSSLQICQSLLFVVTFCFKAWSLLFNTTLCIVHLELNCTVSVRLKSSFLTNSALSLYSPWHKLHRYKPASADNASDRNAPSFSHKQDAQPWGEQEHLQLLSLDQTAEQKENQTCCQSLFLCF